MKEFLDVFSDDLLLIPHEQEIDFDYNLFAVRQTIWIPPYRMGPPLLKELMSHYKDFLDKSFIQLIGQSQYKE